MSHTVKWKRVTEARYWEMLEILPPAMQRGGDFMVGEPCTHRTCRITGRDDVPTFRAFIETNGPVEREYFEALEDMTIAEFKAFDQSTMEIVEETKAAQA